MNPFTKIVLALCCTLALAAPLAPQQRDPLNDAETDQLREVAQEPYKRLKLMIKFAGERLDTVEAAQKDDKAKGGGKRVHDALQDFRELVDELDDNIDDFVQKQSDLRKALGEVISAETSFDSRLKVIKARAEDPKNADEYKSYNFALQDAMEAVNLSLEDAKKTLGDQTTALSNKK
ncbi:MAG: hypothetical protein ACXVZX_08900 [Terriglobales bacterium]